MGLDFITRFLIFRNTPDQCHKTTLEIMMDKDKIKPEEIPCDEFMNIVGQIYRTAINKDKYQGKNKSDYVFRGQEPMDSVYQSYRYADKLYIDYKSKNEIHRFVTDENCMTYRYSKEGEKTSVEYSACFIYDDKN